MGARPTVALVVPPPAFDDAREMLRAWDWLLPERVAPVGVNRLGDWYLATPDGAIHLLSVWEGSLEQVASDRTAWKAWLASAEGQEANWAELVLLLHDQGKRPAAGECFAFEVPPSLGAPIDAAKVRTMSLGVLMAALGQTLRPR